MNITGLQNLMGMVSGNQSHTMLFSPNSALRADLQVGKVVSGSVESNLGNSQYAVQFSGERYVVDSKVPLKANEIIHGRVIGVGDKVELQRIYQEKANSDKQSITQQNLQHLYEGGKAGLRSAEVLQSYRASLTSDEQLSLINMLKGSKDSEAIILSAVVLNKMGITVNESSLTTLYPALSTTIKEKFSLQNLAAHLDFDASSGKLTSSKTITELSAFIASVVNELPESQLKQKVLSQNHEQDELAANAGNLFEDDSSSNDSKHDSEELLFDARRVLLNSQSDGTVSHRVAVIPFMINEKLIEVDVAFFSQRQQYRENSIEYKKIVLSLNLDNLGKVDIEIGLANKNARVKINAENSLITDEMVKYMPELKADLQAQKVKIDELSYETSITNNLGNVISSVVDHYVTQDSLSRVY